MNYKQQLIDHLVNQSKLQYGDDTIVKSTVIAVPEYITNTALDLVTTNHQWYLDNLATSTRTYQLFEHILISGKYATLLIGTTSYLNPCQIKERFPYGEDELGMPSFMWSRDGESIDISVVYYPSNDDWVNIYAANREYIIRNYLRYEEEQEKLRIQLDKEQSVINKYRII